MDDSNVDFCYYQFYVEATDSAGNVGIARAFVVIIPDGFDCGANQDPKHFVRLINDSPASYVIQTTKAIWDTIELDLFF